jgi:hypothetical protein
LYHNYEKSNPSCKVFNYCHHDGSINEVEMTSQGAGSPLKADQETDAARACLLYGDSDE